MKLWGSRTKRQPAPDEDAATAARLVETWFGELGPEAAAEPARRWRETGRLDPGDARRLAAWYRERARLHLLGARDGEGPLIRPGSPEDAERTRDEALSVTRDVLALGRWLRARGHE
ncbi:hypothetical protein ACIP98_03830 [Streptomyces sp. NPDC088354]|uniref:hypothetical protein n=1 Tax=unclassified Streptomyces TaxID=2593676 RepID=UPI0029BE8008|nr:hypothetical protein [Streptomyces sp. MI02-7b]MDX3075566.1 hypothetical protein [Streptomyces sp. MI02-7b]